MNYDRKHIAGKKGKSAKDGKRRETTGKGCERRETIRRFLEK